MAEFIEEDAVTNAKLAEVFNAAFYTASLDEDGDLVVRTDEGFKVLITVDEKKTLIVMRAIFGLIEHAPMQGKLELANKLNDKVVFARFSVPREDVLYADYFLPYEQGVPAFLVVRSFKWFSMTVQGGIGEHDTDDLVE